MNDAEHHGLIERALEGDEEALAAAFTHYRPRLRTMVALRLHPLLQRRVDASDVLQDAFVELSRQLPEFSKKRDLPFFLWLRLVIGKCLIQLHREHLDAKKRSVKLEVSIHGGGMPEATSISLASQLLGHFTAVSQQAMRAEAHAQLHERLASMDPIDREILALRHLEELSTREAALELGIAENTASKRYGRALRRLRDILAKVPGLLPDGVEQVEERGP